jgi:hypothetical protein
MKIDTLKAFRAIGIDPYNFKKLASKKRKEIKVFKIDIDINPVLSRRVDIVQWVRILLFYSRVCDYLPAKMMLEDAKRILLGRSGSGK